MGTEELLKTLSDPNPLYEYATGTGYYSLEARWERLRAGLAAALSRHGLS